MGGRGVIDRIGGQAVSLRVFWVCGLAKTSGKRRVFINHSKGHGLKMAVPAGRPNIECTVRRPLCKNVNTCRVVTHFPRGLHQPLHWTPVTSQRIRRLETLNVSHVWSKINIYIYMYIIKNTYIYIVKLCIYCICWHACLLSFLWLKKHGLYTL